MADVTLRAVSAADIAAVTAIYAEAVVNGTATFELDPPSEADMARRMADLVDHGYPYLVAESAAGILGYAYAGAYHRRPAYRATVEDSVYVAAEARGCGTGRVLLGGLIEACEGCGFRQMVAIIGDSANAASLQLHRSAGFAPVGTLRNVGFKFGRWLDTVLMQRTLGAGDGSPPTV